MYVFVLTASYPFRSACFEVMSLTHVSEMLMMMTTMMVMMMVMVMMLMMMMMMMMTLTVSHADLIY